MSLRSSFGFAWIVLFSSPAYSGEFDRIEGEGLARIARGERVKHRRSLTLKEMDGLPVIFKETRSSFIVIKTGAGNVVKLLVSQALRKAEVEDSPPVPVLVLERFETFEPGKAGSRLARGAGVLLFEGFQIDLDSAQIVPNGQGGDLTFLIAGEGGARLEARGKGEILTLEAPLTMAPALAGPSPGKAVLPADFGGRYHLQADGRWSGILELEVADRQITGRFRSEANGTSYPVTGEVDLDPANKANFTVKFPRSEQEYEGFLWTEGKNAISGTFLMSGRVFGFVAIREGTKASPGD